MSDLGLYLNNKSIELGNSNLGKVNAVVDSVKNALKAAGIKPGKLNIENLIESMKMGVDGCEGGCPSNATGFVRRGFTDYKLNYTEGGFIEAVREVDGQTIKFVTYPDADKMRW